MRFVLEPRLASPVIARGHGADDPLRPRQERLQRGDRHETLAAREEGAHVPVALRVDDDALAELLSMADALPGG